MANEITHTFQTLLNNAGLTDNHSSGSIAIDQATNKLVRNVLTVTTSEAAIDLGGVAVPGIAIFQNLDDTNFVEIGVFGFIDGVGGTGFISVVKLKPGEQYCFRLSTGAPFVRADTASVELFYIIYDD